MFSIPNDARLLISRRSPAPTWVQKEKVDFFSLELVRSPQTELFKPSFSPPVRCSPLCAVLLCVCSPASFCALPLQDTCWHQTLLPSPRHAQAAVITVLAAAPQQETGASLWPRAGFEEIAAGGKREGFRRSTEDDVHAAPVIQIQAHHYLGNVGREIEHTLE